MKFGFFFFAVFLHFNWFASFKQYRQVMKLVTCSGRLTGSNLKMFWQMTFGESAV